MSSPFGRHTHHEGARNLDSLNLPPVSDLVELPPSPIYSDYNYASPSTDDLSTSDAEKPLLPTSSRRQSITEKHVPADADDKQESEEYDPSFPRGNTIQLWRHYLFKIHKYSSYSFSAFVALHAVTVAGVPAALGIDAGESALLLARVAYQTPGIEETLVFGSLAAHLVSGVILRIHKMQRDRAWYSRRVKMSRVSFSGYLLTPFLLAHVFVARIVPLKIEGDSSLVSLRFIARGFERHKTLAWTGYSALVGLTVFHVGYGWARWLRVRKSRMGVVRVLGVLAIAVGVIGLRRVVREGAGEVVEWLVKRYDAVYDYADSLAELPMATLQRL
ncbi:uncharacterized protein V1518DRAFT_408498 [Limtongia smithiae]|uniref:uncharacterized protein n=1 Tax=Limtongia smithiae TaxID=1125753 RepID=UPI0034CFA362